MTTNTTGARAAHLDSIITTPDARWNAAAAAYLLRDGLALADRTFGDYAKANVCFDHAKAEIEAKYGREYRAAEGGAEAFEPVWAAMKASEEARYRDFLAPLWASARDLALTPAPTLPAALFKIEVIRHEELDNDIYMARDPMEVIAEDFARLSGTAADQGLWDGLVQRFETVEAIPLDDTNDDLIDEAGDLLGQIMAMPAPNAKAAQWKLDWLLATDGGSTASYDAGYVAQATADYRRFLGGEA